jgi:putative transcriptional regulator
LLTEHNENGSVGFVLNKPVDIAVCEILNDFPQSDCKVSIGGPVNTNTVHYIHTLGELVPESIKIISGIYWGGNFEKIKSLIESGIINNNQIRFFLGYSGWSPSQLDNELSQNAWIVGDTTAEEVMNVNQVSSWNETLAHMGEKYRSLANFPENPGLN